MNIIESAQTELLGIFEKGAARSSAKLAAVSGADWAVHIVSIDVGTGERFRSIMARDEAEHLGVFFSSAGERYLVLFSEHSGKAVLDAYARDWPSARRPAERLRESALAEIANVIINGLSGELADRQGMARVISAPTTARGAKAEIYAKAFGGLPAIGAAAMVDVMIHISSPALAADCTLMLRLDSLAANFLLNTDPDVPPDVVVP